MNFATLNTNSVSLFGKSISYNAIGAGVVNIKAVFDKNYEGVDPGTGALVQSTEPVAHVVLSDLPRHPAQDDELTIDGITYYVVNVQEDSEGMAKLALHR